MWQVNDVVVISDIHLSKKKGGAEKESRELFQADEALEQFLTWILLEVTDSLVVLNGDVLDYLSVSPGPEDKTAVMDFLRLPERTSAIIEDHPAVFDALARLATSPRHEIAFVAGNHDPELIFPSVQQVIERRLSGSAKAAPLRWFVQGAALVLQVGGVRTLIEHGDVLDAWNRIDRSALRGAVSLDSRGLLHHHRYQAPPGSRLVLDCLTWLKDDYPWVEILKPEASTIPHLLRYCLPKERLPEFKDALFDYLQSARNHLVVQLYETLGPQRLFMADADELESDAADSALDHFRQLWQDLNRQAATFRMKSLISKLRQAAVKDSFFGVAKADGGTYKILSFLVRNGADLLIHGHTHSAKAYKVAARADDGSKEGLYLNSGTWAQLMRLPAHHDSDDIWLRFVDDLLDGEACGFAKGFQRLTFARVSSDGGPTRARLHEWKEGSPVDLASFTFAPEHRTWVPES